MKTIKFYRKSQFGNDREFVHPDNATEGELIRRLILQKTITPEIRDTIVMLSGGQVTFEQTIAP